jgi:prepilin-type N-terminal cleavage/methylation domain-containing protein
MKRSETGYSLIELMVALAVLAVVTAQLFLVFTGQQRAYVANERLLDVQEDARLVIDLILTEARMAGFMLPRRNGISSRDGGNAASDALCVSDFRALDLTTVQGADARFDAADVLAVPLADRVQLAGPAELDLDAAGAATDFAVSQGIIIADPNTSHCASITAITPGVNPVIEFDPPLNPLAYNAATTFVAPAIVYDVAPGGLTRNAMQMSPEVEDLQVEYGIDIDGDGIVSSDPNDGEFPVDDLAGFDPARIRNVRVSVVTRTPQNDPEYQGPGFPGAANRDAGTTDGFRRRRFVASVSPRNMM